MNEGRRTQGRAKGEPGRVKEIICKETESGRESKRRSGKKYGGQVKREEEGREGGLGWEERKTWRERKRKKC